MTSIDEHIESIRARGGDRKSLGCARRAPAGRSVSPSTITQLSSLVCYNKMR
jgi:hypothetical protein